MLGVFFIEATVFGRGLKALEVNLSRMKKLLMLDPSYIDDKAKKDIKAKFRLIQNREVLNIEDELKQEDRQNFDKAVFEAYGIADIQNKVRNSFLTLYKIRNF